MVTAADSGIYITENASENSAVDAGLSSTGGSKGKGESADTAPKGDSGSYKDIKEVLDAFGEKHLASNQTDILLDILRMLKDTIYT